MALEAENGDGKAGAAKILVNARDGDDCAIGRTAPRKRAHRWRRHCRRLCGEAEKAPARAPIQKAKDT
jgi:hypothetical protein